MGTTKIREYRGSKTHCDYCGKPFALDEVIAVSSDGKLAKCFSIVLPNCPSKEVRFNLYSWQVIIKTDKFVLEGRVVRF